MFKTLLLTLCFFLSQGVYCLAQNDSLEQVIESLEAYHHRFPKEKVYLHFDKPYYSIGDDMWFKAYLTVGNAHQLSGMSKILYVELINPLNEIVQSVRLPVMGGITFGDFKLDRKHQAGNYRVRAYTNWMRNFDTGYFFDKMIKIGNGLNDPIITQSRFNLFDEEGNSRNIQAHITFTDLESRPLSNKEVQYAVNLQGKPVRKEKSNLDENGSLQFNFKMPKGGSTDDLLIETDVYSSADEHIKKQLPVQLSTEGYTIRFFPEGGRLIAGMLNKVAFKVYQNNGLAVKASAIIKDQTGEKVAALETDFAGIGNFTMIPDIENTYTCLLSLPGGKVEEVALPPVAPEGYILTVNNLLEEKIMVEISTSSSLVKSQQVSLILEQDGQVFFAGRVRITKPKMVISIPKKGLADGISELALLSTSDEIIAHRKIFHRNKETNLPLKIIPDKKQYGPRQQVNVDILAGNAGDSVRIGSFSVSVINLDKIPVKGIPEENIRSSLLLTSASRDYIQSPSHYLDSSDYTTKRQLDNLLLTFERDSIWKEIALPRAKEIQYSPEKDLRVSGIVTRNNGTPVPNARVLILATQAGLAIDTTSGPDGRFAFDRLLFYDSTRFVIQARDERGKKNVKVVLDEIPQQMVSKNKNSPDMAIDVNRSMETYLKNSRERFEELYRSGELEKSILLNDVEVKVTKKNKAEDSDNLNGAGNADQVLGEDDLQACTDLTICLQGRLMGVLFRNGVPYSTRSPQIPMTVLVDGADLSPDALSLIPASDVASIEVLRTIGYLGIYGSRGAGGVILVTTKRGNNVSGRDIYSPGIVTYSPQGYYESRAFPSPDYNENPEEKRPDLRSTIFWEPNVLTDEDGKASLHFFTADQAGRYRITVEGIDLMGRIGRSVTYIDIIN